MDIAIRSAASIVSPWTHWFLYGATGSGKTQAASTFPDPLFLVPAAEGSHLTLAGREIPYITLGRDANDEVIGIRDHLNGVLTMLERRHADMRKALTAGDEQAAFDAFPWQTVVLESMTHLCAMLQDDISQNGKIKMDQQRWGMMSDFLRSVHTRLRGLDCHVVFTALAKIEGEDGSTQEGCPDIPGKMSRLLPSACDAIGYCETREGTSPKAPPTYTVHFRQHRVYPARVRFRGVPGSVQDFTFAAIEKYLPK